MMSRWVTLVEHRLKIITARIPHVGFVAVLFVFLLLTTLHSIIVPITQGEDELAHYRYISFIAETGRLPLDYAERERAWYRADWPPLYHLLVGWLVSPLDTTRPPLKDVGDAPYRRLVGEIFYPRLIIYTEDVNWPWQDGILAWHLGRFVSILFSAGALVFTYLTVLELFRGSSAKKNEGEEKPPLHFRFLAPLLVTALLAFTPRFLFTSAMLGDDSLLILLSAIFIWLLLRALRGDDRWSVYSLLGLVLGLSIATKYSTALLPLAILPVVWWRARQMSWRWPQWLGRIAISWLGTFVGASWWFGWIGYHFNTIREDGLLLGLLRPLLASGPDVSMRRIFALFTGSQFTGQARPDAVEAGTFGDWWVYLFQTFWGVPVLEQDPLFPWAYLLLLAFCLLALWGLWRFWWMANAELRLTLAVLALIVLLLFPFPILRFFLTRNILETGQGRHILYPAAQSIPLLLVLGWGVFAKQRRRGTEVRGREKAGTHEAIRPTFYVSRFTVVVPFLLLIWSIFQIVYMKTTYPDPLPVRTSTFDAASIPQPLKRNFGDDIQLLGYDFEPDPELAIINLTLYWRSLNPVAENYRTQVQLLDPEGEPHFTWLSHPLNGRYPTRAWDEEDVIRDKLRLPLAAVPPQPYTIQIDLLHEAKERSLVAEPLTIIQFELPTRQPIVNASTVGDLAYRLWLADTPARQRQTLPLSWKRAQVDADQEQIMGEAAAGGDSALLETRVTARQISSLQPEPEVSWSLVGPDDIPRYPVVISDATAIFIVGAEWPSGDYRLHVQDGIESHQTEPLLTVANEFRLFNLPPDVPARPGWTPVDAVLADPQDGQAQVKLLGYVLPTRRVEPGGGLPLTLYWQSLAPVLDDLVTFAVLLDADQKPHGSVDRYPAGFYSPMLWAENEVVGDEFVLPVQAEAPPGTYWLHLGQYRLLNGQPESLALRQGDRLTDITAVVIGPIKVDGPPPEVTTVNPDPQRILNQPLGGQITLVGYDLTHTSDSELHFTFYWRADTDLQDDYTTFLHLRDAANQTIAQKDGPPAAGRYPTSLWESGEIIVDDIILPLDGLAPGRYTPVVGLYEAATETRLPVPNVPANEIALEAVDIAE